MNSLNYCHVTTQVNAHPDDYTPPVEGLFDDGVSWFGVI